LPEARGQETICRIEESADAPDLAGNEDLIVENDAGPDERDDQGSEQDPCEATRDTAAPLCTYFLAGSEGWAGHGGKDYSKTEQ
jgi:hypothetical protein